MDDSRFARLEKRLDDLADAKIRLTMLEERRAQNARSLERAFKQVEDVLNKVNEVVTAQAISNTKIGFNERIAWLFISGVVGIAAYFVK